MSTNFGFIEVPVLEPNGPDGAYFVDCGEGSYPRGTQTHAAVWTKQIVAITPAGMSIENQPVKGSYLHLAGHACSVFTVLSVDDVLKKVRESAQ